MKNQSWMALPIMITMTISTGASAHVAFSSADSSGAPTPSSSLPFIGADVVPSVSASSTALYDTASFNPSITVTKNPEPVVVKPVTRSTARAVAHTSNVDQSTPAGSILAEAEKYIGTPYVSGGSSPSGFDCSGFTQYVYAQQGISIPRSSDGQLAAGTVVSDPQPGDIIYSPGHVAIYAGDGMMIDSPRPGKSVQYRAMWQTNPVYVRF